MKFRLIKPGKSAGLDDITWDDARPVNDVDLTKGNNKARVQSLVAAGWLEPVGKSKAVPEPVEEEDDEEDTEAMEAYTETELKALTRSDLQGICDDMGIDRTGTKKDIIGNILEAQSED